MSIVNPTFSEFTSGGFKQFKEAVLLDGKLAQDEILKNKYEQSQYQPSAEEKEIRQRILRDYQNGVLNMWTPRVEFNDLAVIQRMQADQMRWNTYQPNNGEAASADDIQGWRSNAMRPVTRNKVISITAHATARLIFPKIFSYNENSDEQEDAARVMEDLMEWAADQSNYKKVALYRVITALTDPASIGYTEYGEVYRRVKLKKKSDGSWDYKIMLDEILSGFQDVVVPVDELFIENFYEPDIQKQAFLVWRRVQSYQLLKAKYGSIYPNFDKYVRPGVQALHTDANNAFYYVYDPQMRQYDCEEIIYWNKALDVKIIMVNGVVLTEPDNPNPRNDKLYPFEKFGYEIINNRCFYYKSLVFKMMQDDNIINTLYPMIIDGTYLQLVPPMINTGGESIGSDVIVPGAVTTLSSPDAKLTPIQVGYNLRDSFATLAKVEESINDSSQSEIQQGQRSLSSPTAYQISREEQNAATVLGLFVQMIAQHVKEFGRLRLGDILQYLTIADVDKIEDDSELVFKTFLLQDRQSNGKTKSRKIQFDMNLPDEALSPEKDLDMSYDILKEEGGASGNFRNAKTELYKVNPSLFRNLKYVCTVSPDVINPRSEELIRAFALETYDRAIQNPVLDPEQVTRDFLLSVDPRGKKDPDKYFAKQQMNNAPSASPVPSATPASPASAIAGSIASSASSPLQALMGASSQPPAPTPPQL